ncbi:hypothetical protein KXD40_002533 [Peronospora effusa]|uniref:Uncharacterized protein n=1 Tax=Peronospora effusa TaxID=542832 RepID=A0A3M6VQ83_9STRA|nr:hypothetical protein DD238_004282 [Peronospora effusa]UIZ27170.1 hypothetical protein KXD40_002533 [Peronospora effusa]
MYFRHRQFSGNVSMCLGCMKRLWKLPSLQWIPSLEFVFVLEFIVVTVLLCCKAQKRGVMY